MPDETIERDEAAVPYGDSGVAVPLWACPACGCGMTWGTQRMYALCPCWDCPNGGISIWRTLRPSVWPVDLPLKHGGNSG